MLICSNCFSSRFLRTIIESYGEPGPCSLCETSGTHCVPAADLRPNFKPLIECYGTPHWLDVGPPETNSLAGVMKVQKLSVFSERLSIARQNEFLNLMIGPGGRSATEFWASPLNAGILYGTSGWEYFCEEVKHRHRFSPNSTVSELLMDADRAHRDLKLKITAGLSFYRAQAHLAAELGGELPSKRLEAPPGRLATAGRANPAGISYLYVADNADTAIAEVRPYSGGFVSLAVVTALNDLRIFDLTAKFILEYRDPFAIDFLKEYKLAILASKMDEAFAEPIGPFTPDIDYAPTQVAAELIASAGYSGIRYRSSLDHGGFNYVFFDPAAFEVTYNRSVRVTQVKVAHEPHTFLSLGQVLSRMAQDSAH